MKYIKLFEQFEEEEPWWEDESPLDDLGKELKVGDYVVVLDNSSGGKLKIGGVYKIYETHWNGRSYEYVVENDIKGKLERWWYMEEDVRRATEKEIKVGHSLQNNIVE